MSTSRGGFRATVRRIQEPPDWGSIGWAVTMSKLEIVEELGEAAVLLPRLIGEALMANERLKLRLSLLQEARAKAEQADYSPRNFAAELAACGLAALRSGDVLAGVRAIGGTRFGAAGLGAVLGGIVPDLKTMLTPLRTAQAPGWEALSGRLVAVAAALPPADRDDIEAGAIDAMTTTAREAGDSVHLLVMDLHKAINRLAAETAVESIDGAKVHHLDDADRARVRAFMAGINRTAPLAFGHPGLGTTAAHVGANLIVQNDIGETDAHVLVVHVDAASVTVTYTDVHRRRARFFMSLFDQRMQWTPLTERAAKGLADGRAFYLLTGRFQATDEADLRAFLEHLGSRIVFLIDWNKARKALQSLVGRDTAIELLAWAAAHDFGQRAFVTLGGAELVFEAIRSAASGRVPYGARLEQVLGRAETVDFLRHVLRETSEGLKASRTARLIKDDIHADLAQRFETAESAVLTILVRHLGLSRMLAGRIADALGPGGEGELGGLVAQAKRLEAKADGLTMQAREICARLRNGDAVRRLVDDVEDAMDALDECAFLTSLARAGMAAEAASVEHLADIAGEALGQLVRATEAAARRPERDRSDVMAALAAIDAVIRAEREADAAERACIGDLARSAGVDARTLTLGLEVARTLETSTDHMAHAALALRGRLLEELSA